MRGATTGRHDSLGDTFRMCPHGLLFLALTVYDIWHFSYLFCSGFFTLQQEGIVIEVFFFFSFRYSIYCEFSAGRVPTMHLCQFERIMKCCSVVTSTEDLCTESKQETRTESLSAFFIDSLELTSFSLFPSRPCAHTVSPYSE